MKLAIAVLGLGMFYHAAAQLKLDEIMAGNSFIGNQPDQIEWSPNNSTVYFKWNHDNELVVPYYQTNINKVAPQLIQPKELSNLPVNGFMSNSDNTAVFFKKGTDLIQYDGKDYKIIFSNSLPFLLVKVINKNQIIIKQQDHFYLWDREAQTFNEIVSFSDNNDKSKKASANYLERQQKELFEYINLKEAQKNARTAYSEKVNHSSIPKHNLEGQSLGEIEFNNALTYAIYRTDQYPKNKNSKIDQFITSNGYLTNQNARPKVGKSDPIHQLHLMNLKTGKVSQIKIDHLPGIKTAPQYLNLYNPDFVSELSTPKNVAYTQIKFNLTSNLALVEIKSYDNKDRWICTIDVSSGILTCLDHQHDEAWIGGPGISGWNMVPGNIGWVPNQNSVYFQSEKTGYSHLYSHDISTGKTEQLTKGNFEVHAAQISKNGKTFYISANKTHPGNRGFYHFDVLSKTWTPILEKDGNFQVHISPNEKHLAIRYSYQNQPWELYLAANKVNGKLERITKSTTEKFHSYKWRKAEIITLKNELDQSVSARIYRPELKQKNGAAIIFVHGAGYLQNAHNWWSGYYREYMFHNLLCDLGYTILDIDYRASKGYGRDHRTAIYRHMGGADLKDQLIGRRYLIEKEGILEDKVGIYGGSYGGFITIMALLTEPGKFKCGAAIRSVTDWAHYNHEYTSNILNTPETDSIAFRQSSPIYYADQLQDELLILHGMVDDNVQFQDVVRLNQRFIELGKQSFTMALYPVEPHGFIQTSSWVDEYTRILNLFNTQLLNLD